MFKMGLLKSCSFLNLRQGTILIAILQLVLSTVMLNMLILGQIHEACIQDLIARDTEDVLEREALEEITSKHINSQRMEQAHHNANEPAVAHDPVDDGDDDDGRRPVHLPVPARGRPDPRVRRPQRVQLHRSLPARRHGLRLLLHVVRRLQLVSRSRRQEGRRDPRGARHRRYLLLVHVVDGSDQEDAQGLLRAADEAAQTTDDAAATLPSAAAAAQPAGCRSSRRAAAAPGRMSPDDDDQDNRRR
ncbi:unnamed protein product [Trichogramma brassicae]|uniref:Uncharacterized protein n=1 Tax=Trichogramma brassicae TaxID=86971 RepID=A0A6H5IRC1_9HYME|nr:unnamed protein product [Trichogramma brassicae]